MPIPPCSLMRAFALLAFLISWPCAGTEGLKAGIATRDITPREPVPMWGYSARHDALSTGVLDPLFATALVLQFGDQKIAIVGLDLGRCPNDRVLVNIRRRIRLEAGISNSIIAASHTHNGPVLEFSDEPGKGRGRFDGTLRYYSDLENAIVQSVLEANTTVRSAKIGTRTTTLTNFSFNRQSLRTDALSDRDLSLIRFDEPQGQPIALVVNVAIHPTILPESETKLSADFVGALKTNVREKTGAPVLFLQGAAGDQAPEDHNGRLNYRDFGNLLAAEVVQQNARLVTTEVPHPTLKFQEQRFRFQSRIDLRDPVMRRRCDKLFFPELISNYADSYADGIQPVLTVAVLNGDLALVGASGEFFSAHAIRLKERARLPHVLFVGYCNGYEQYFPTIEAVAEGGYGADEISSPVAIGAGEEMMNKALIRLYRMIDKPAH